MTNLVSSYGVSTLVRTALRVAYQFAKVYPSSLSFAELQSLLGTTDEGLVYWLNASTVIVPSLDGYYKLNDDPKHINLADVCRPFVAHVSFDANDPTFSFWMSVDQVIYNTLSNTTLQSLLNRNEAELKMRSEK